MSTTGLLGLVGLAAVTLCACEREERDYRPTPAAAARAQTITLPKDGAGAA